VTGTFLVWRTWCAPPLTGPAAAVFPLRNDDTSSESGLAPEFPVESRPHRRYHQPCTSHQLALKHVARAGGGNSGAGAKILLPSQKESVPAGSSSRWTSLRRRAIAPTSPITDIPSPPWSHARGIALRLCGSASHRRRTTATSRGGRAGSWRLSAVEVRQGCAGGGVLCPLERPSVRQGLVHHRRDPLPGLGRARPAHGGQPFVEARQRDATLTAPRPLPRG
jgi:hypothetical protein